MRSLIRLLLSALLLAPAAAAALGARVLIAGETGSNGIFDPSVEYEPGGAIGWLSYSSVYGNVLPWGANVETRLARSFDSGASWSFVQVLNASAAGTLVRPGMPDLQGVWNYEVSSLVHDPDDSGAEWKLFAHRVFRKTEQNFTEEQNVPSHSWITLRTASDPAGMWSAERALFSSGPLPPFPYDTVEFAVNSFDDSLLNSDILVYSEPGAFYRQGVLYVSLTALTSDGPDRIVLLSSIDHGLSWDYAGTPLSNADAVPFGYVSFDGSAIAEDEGRVFLMVTPASTTVTHDGTMVFEFQDLAEGELFREGGVPVLQSHIPARPGLPVDRRGGQADFHAHNTAAGLMRLTLEIGDYPLLFQIFATGRRLASQPVPAAGGVSLGVGALLILAVGVARALRSRGC